MRLVSRRNRRRHEPGSVTSGRGLPCRDAPPAGMGSKLAQSRRDARPGTCSTRQRAAPASVRSRVRDGHLVHLRWPVLQGRRTWRRCGRDQPALRPRPDRAMSISGNRSPWPRPSRDAPFSSYFGSLRVPSSARSCTRAMSAQPAVRSIPETTVANSLHHAATSAAADQSTRRGECVTVDAPSRAVGMYCHCLHRTDTTELRAGATTSAAIGYPSVKHNQEDELMHIGYAAVIVALLVILLAGSSWARSLSRQRRELQAERDELERRMARARQSSSGPSPRPRWRRRRRRTSWPT